LIAGAKNRPFAAWSNAGQAVINKAVIYKDVEFSVTATSEPDIWQWRFQIGDKITSGKTRTRLIHLATRRVHMRIDAKLKATSLADHGDDRKI
jgi:hypothetical protein